MKPLSKKWLKAGWSYDDGFTMEAYSRQGREKQIVSLSLNRTMWNLTGFDRDGVPLYSIVYSTREKAFKAAGENK